MKDIKLSICIPTYNRSKTIYNTLMHLIQCSRDDIEFVISDNASPDDTETLVKSIKDPRIKYFKNKSNYGIDLNILKCVKRANGSFIYFITDEDRIKLKLIPWIIGLFDKTNKLNLMIGTVLDERTNPYKIVYQFKDRIFNPGASALLKIFLKEGYLAGIIIKRDVLDLTQARKYVGCIYIHQVLMGQAMKSGYTITSSKIFCSIPNKQYKSEIYMLKSYCKGKSFYSPLGTFSQLEDKLVIIKELLSEYPKVKEVSIEIEKSRWAELLARAIFMSPRSFIKNFHILVRIMLKNKEITKSHQFWFNFIIRIKKYLFSHEYWQKKIFHTKR